MMTNAFDLLIGFRSKKRFALNGLWPQILPENDTLLGKLIQLFGATGSGKSQLLYQLMARAVLPTEYGGKSSDVLFLDLTHKFNIEVFVKHIIKLQQEYESSNSNMMEVSSSSSSGSRIVENCLKAIIKIDCYSIDEFHSSLNELEEILARNGNISLLAVDGLTTFFWEEFHRKLQSKYSYCQQLIKRLRKFAQQHNICCIYTIDQVNTITVNKKTEMDPLPNLADYILNIAIEKNGIHRSVNNIKFRIADDGIHLLTKSHENKTKENS